MPEPATLLLFSLSALTLTAVPGPNLIYIVTRSATQGRRVGLASALGVECGTLIHIAAAAAGISAALASSDVAFAIVRYAGAAYLVYLGIRALARRNAPSGSVDVSEGAFKQAWRQGVLVQLLNPKVGLFFLAFLPQFLDTEKADVALQILVLGGLLALIGLAVDCVYALVAGAAGAALRARPGRLRAVSAAVYIALGLAAALTG